MKNKIIYSDKLVEIEEDSILVRDYYYPFGDKRVNFDNIEIIIVQKPTLLSGKYRYYGSGDFRTWFPPDNRSSRDKIFTIKIKKKWWRVGLTVENSETVLRLFKNYTAVQYRFPASQLNRYVCKLRKSLRWLQSPFGCS